MGIGIKKKRAKEYTEQMDKARVLEIEQSVLGVKDIESRLTLDCERVGDEPSLVEGRAVRLIDLRKERVEVFIGGRPVGTVLEAGSALLREKHGIALREGRSFRATVSYLSEFTDSFTVELG